MYTIACYHIDSFYPNHMSRRKNILYSVALLFKKQKLRLKLSPMNTVNWWKLGSIYPFVNKKFNALKGMIVLFLIMLKDNTYDEIT